MKFKTRAELDLLLAQLDAAIPALIDGHGLLARQNLLAAQAKIILDLADLEQFDYTLNKLEVLFRKYHIHTVGPAGFEPPP